MLNKATIDCHNGEPETDIKCRRIKYLNNLVEHDHHAIKRLTRPMLGLKSCLSAAAKLAGIELYAYDPQEPVADDRRNASGAIILRLGPLGTRRDSDMHGQRGSGTNRFRKQCHPV